MIFALYNADRNIGTLVRNQSDDIQLILEQHKFELLGYPYKQICSINILEIRGRFAAI